MNIPKILFQSTLILLIFSTFVIAQGRAVIVPSTINYQGYLTDSDGKALDGTYRLTFYLYDEVSGNRPWIWQETHTSVLVANGLFNVLLGSVDSLTAEIFTGERFLSVKVANEVEMTPRMRLATAPYALQSEKMEPDYDSGWFAVSAAKTYALDLGFTLTDLPMSIQIYYSNNAAPQMGIDEIWLVQAGQYYYLDAGMNAYVEIHNASTIKIHTGRNYVFYAYRSGGETAPYPPNATSGHYRVRLWE